MTGLKPARTELFSSRRIMSNIPSSIRDNYLRGKVGEVLKSTITPNSRLSIVSAYFTIYAYEALKSELSQIDNMRFLFGDPRFVDTFKPNKSSSKAFSIQDEGLELNNQIQQSRIARDCSDWIKEKVEIRSIIEQNLMHGKMYHIFHDGIEDAIIGSSNFTVSGLGLGNEKQNNLELNLVVDSNRDRQDLKAWFDELWEDVNLVEDVKPLVLDYLQKLYVDNPPEFIYFKTLYHIFESYLADQIDDSLGSITRQIVDTQIWQKLYPFQKDGVKGAINKILAYNGCILADSVGLGKTYEGLAIIKYFELRNDRVLVLCPKKLRENWTVYQAQNNSELNTFLQDRFNYTVLAHTDLSRDKGWSGDIDLSNINWGNYDLVVIDESHNFRNNTPGVKDEDGNIIRYSRYERLMNDIIKAGVHTKVLLLSATPVNNSLKDLRNQISIITEDTDNVFLDSLGIPSVKDSLAAAQRTFTEWAKQNHNHDTKELISKFSPSFFKLLDSLTIARSRKHIQRYYKDDITLLGGFPSRNKPIAIYSKIDLEDQFPTYDTLNDQIARYRLSLFNPSYYLLEDFQEEYNKDLMPNFNQKTRESFLIGMMKVNFLKRLESSVYSFNETLKRTISKIDNLISRIKEFQDYRQTNTKLDFDDVRVEDAEDEDLQNRFIVGKKLEFKMEHLNVEDWLKDLKDDRNQLHKLQLVANEVTATRDAKLEELKRLISQKVLNPTTNKNGQLNKKVLVFTAFADTADYLYRNLKDWAQTELGIHVALVTGGSMQNKTTFGKADFNHILINFSPVSKERNKMRSMPQDAEIDLLIATDCISEGQNLQDCDWLINYDIHWNPVRVIQRFGRIDRIGSINSEVQLINFWPTQDLDKYIDLKNRVEAKMALVDISATNEDNLLNPDEIRELVDDDLKYRDKQLKRLREEVLDLEDFNESVSLTDFTLEDFRAELMRYIQQNRKTLENAPTGLYGIVPTDIQHPVIKPGVIFCLRQKVTGKEVEMVNPLKEYFLVYVQNDGTVRLNFTQPKQILEIYQLLCVGKQIPIDSLCRLFNQETQNGIDLRQYNELLNKSIRAIQSAFSKRMIQNIQIDRHAQLPDLDHQITDTTDFDLITWLIIKDDNYANVD